MNNNAIKTPAHLWTISILAVLWNAVGAFDYTATQMAFEAYMSQFSEEQLEYFYGFPAWAKAVWAIAVWSSLLASFLLLFRSAWSVWLFGLAILGLALSTVYNFVLSDGLAVMGEEGAYFTLVIWIIAVALFFYSKAMAKRGVLR